MAWTFVENQGTASENTSDNAIAMSPATEIPIDAIVFVAVVSDNIATTDGNSNTHTSITDTDTHTYTNLYEWTETSGSANDGVTISLWATKVTVAIGTGDVITANFSAAITAKAMGVAEFSVAAGKTFSAADQQGAGDPADASISVAISGLSSAARLWLAAVGVEADAGIIDEDSDYTTIDFDTGGSGGTKAGLQYAYRLATLTGDTYNQTTSLGRDHAEILIGIDEVDDGGTTFFETIAVASTMTAALGTANIWARTLAVASTMTATLTRIATYARTLAVASTMTAAVGKKISKFLAVASTMTAALTRTATYARTLAVASTMTAELSRAKLLLQVLAVTSVMTADLASTKLFIQLLAVTSTMTAGVVKKVSKTLAVASTMTAAVVKKTSKTLAVASTMAAGLGTTLTHLQTLAVNSTMTAALALKRTYLQTLAVASTMTAALATLKIDAVAGAARAFQRSLAKVNRFFQSGG